MTSISSTTTATTGTAATLWRQQQQRRDPMAKVAELFGLSTDEVKSKLSDGTSLDDLAEQRGVTHDDLIAAIKEGLPADQATDEVAEKIAGNEGAPPPPHGGPKGVNAGLRDDDKLSRLSTLLDVDSEDLTDQATTASSLVNLLQSNGVDLSRLRSVFASGDLLDVAA